MSTENQALELLKHFEELTRQFAPDVIDMAANVVLVSAINNIVFGGLVAIVLAILTFKLGNGLSRLYLKWQEKDKWFDVDLANVITWSLCLIVILGCFFSSLFNLLDLWNWVALFKPHLALAHKILGL